MSDQAAHFVGSIPEYYDRNLGPRIFAGFAEDLARRVATLAPSEVLELAAGTGIVTRALRDALPDTCKLVATDLNPVIEALADRDWVTLSLEGLPPVEAGRFIVAGSHALTRTAPGKTDIILVRGRFGINHNRWFTNIVKSNLAKFEGCTTKYEKSLVISEILEKVIQIIFFHLYLVKRCLHFLFQFFLSKSFWPWPN